MVVAGCQVRMALALCRSKASWLGANDSGWASGHERSSHAGMYDNGRMFYLIFRNANNSNASTTRQTLVKRQVAGTGW